MKVEQDPKLIARAEALRPAGYQQRRERGRAARRVGPQGQPRGVGARARSA